jgi:hypothetical protein
MRRAPDIVKLGINEREEKGRALLHSNSARDLAYHVPVTLKRGERTGQEKQSRVGLPLKRIGACSIEGRAYGHLNTIEPLLPHR